MVNIKKEWEKHKASKTKPEELDFLNKEQEKAIELSVKKPHLKELVKLNLESGRQKQAAFSLKEMSKEDKEKEQKIKKEEVKKTEQTQKEYAKKQKKDENEVYSLKMEVVSLIAQKKRREATELVVDFIENKEYIYSTREDTKSEMWIYKNGIYNPNGKSYIGEQCRKILGEHFTTHLMNEILSKIEADTYIDSEKFFKNNYIDEIPVENGILNIKQKKLNPFNPEKIFFNKLPVKYNPKSKCPEITNHLKNVLKNGEDVKVLFEVFGFLLYKDYFIEKAIMFIGDGRNGKGKTIDLMKRFLGADNCCSVPLNSLSEGGFRTWDLFGKMANLAGDLSSNALKETSTLKQTTGRDLIGADRKNKSTVNFVNYAKHIFACNDLPRVYDFSRGFWERWILFEFPYTFVKQEIYDSLNEEEKKKYKIMDVFIMDKLSSSEELSGLLNEAIEGFHRILKQKDFSYSIGVDEVKKFWVRKSDSFTSFAMDHLEESYDASITKQKLRKSFMGYCKAHKIKGASDKNIKVVLEEMFGVTESQNSSGMRVWEGVKFKESSNYNYVEGKLSQD